MADSTFYSTVAQILPLFVLALAAERRLGPRENSTDPGFDLLIGLLMVTMAALGELVALSALTGHPPKNGRQYVEISTGFAGLLLYADIVWRQVTAYTTHEPGKLKSRAAKGVGGFLVIGGVALLTVAWLGAIV